VAYAGRYTFHGNRIIHHVELSLFPSWVGTDQERSVELAEDRLTISASPLLLAASSRYPAWSGSASTGRRSWIDRHPTSSTDYDYIEATRPMSMATTSTSETTLGRHAIGSRNPKIS